MLHVKYLFLGRGNSAFEVADHIFGHTNFIHMLSRSRVRLAWNTHYVGDLRAVNNKFLDNYQLKSLDAVLEGPISKIIFRKTPKGQIRLDVSKFFGEPENDNFAMRIPYDRVISCLGFRFDQSIFNSTGSVSAYPGFSFKGHQNKFPNILDDYQAEFVPGMYFAGTISHSVDYRKSSGGFIHGFRYTARALHRILEWKYEKVPWPSLSGKISDLLNIIVKRVNEGSGIYQMFQYLCDVYIINKDNTNFTQLLEFPCRLLHSLGQVSGHNLTDSTVIVMDLEYGANFSGPDKDVFRVDRATADWRLAAHSNFLHPVFYYYDALPTKEDFLNKPSWLNLPKPKKICHILEDFLTTFDAPISHIQPMRRFLESVLNVDLRNHFADSCMIAALTSGKVPLTCEKFLKTGKAFIGTPSQLSYAYNKGLIFYPNM